MAVTALNASQSQNIRFARKAFLIYAANSTVSSIGVALATICDSVVVGNAYGPLGLAVTSVVLPVYVLFDFLSFALGIGGSTAVSVSFGCEDHAAARKTFARTLTLALLSSALVALLGGLFLPQLVALLGGGDLGQDCLRYVGLVVVTAPVFVCAPVLSLMLCADGDPMRSTAGVVTSAVVNLVLDVVFIFGFRSGIQGAAWAMVIGQCGAIAVYLPHFFKKRYGLRLGLHLPGAREAARILRGGMGTSSSYAWQFIYLTVFNNILSQVSGEQGLAIFNLVFNVSMLTYAIVEGISLAVPSLAGTYLGERDRLSLRCVLRLALQTAAVAAVVLAAALALLAPGVVALFGLDRGDIVPLGVEAVRFYAPAIPFACVSSVLCVCWQTMGHPRMVLLAHFLRGCLLPLAIGIPLISALGTRGIAPTLLLAESLSFLTALLLARWAGKRSGAEGLMLLPLPQRENAVYEDVLDGDFRRLPEIVAAVESFCDEQDIDPATAYSIQLTIEELAGNIIQFGFRDEKDHFIAFKVAKFDDDVYVRIRDDASQYDPFARAESAGDELDLDMDMMGVMLIRKKAKSFIYQRRLVFNNLLIIL